MPGFGAEDLRRQADSIVALLEAEVGSACRDSLGRFLLRGLAGRLGIDVEVGTVGGAVHGLYERSLDQENGGQGFLFPQVRETISVFNNPANGRSRFTLAHELGHALAIRYIPEEERNHWDSEDEEHFADLVASRLVLPTSVLEEQIPNFGGSGVTMLDNLTALQAKVRVSFSALVVHLQELVRAGHSFNHAVLVAVEGVDRDTGKDHTPRVQSSCLPNRWSLAPNEALRKVGADTLASAFSDAPPFSTLAITDELRLWDKKKKEAQPFAIEAEAILFTPTSSKRALVASFPTAVLEDALT